MPEAVPAIRQWSKSPWLFLCELGVVALLFVLDIRHHIFISKNLYLFPLAAVSLRLRSLRWKDVGVVRFHSWRRTLALGILFGAAIELLELFVTQPLLERITGRVPDLSVFLLSRGQIKTTLLLLLYVWIVAAFGEEMIYRGYLMNRIAELFNNKRAAWIVSLLAASLVFGFAHLGQGITGQLENVLDGLLLGLIYLGCGRNLAVPIVAHGVTDTIDVFLVFLGKYPGLG
jgi:membrane protease YdiL (CAAX protease family)